MNTPTDIQAIHDPVGTEHLLDHDGQLAESRWRTNPMRRTHWC